MVNPGPADAASGGMVAPFIDPELEWDFRLKNVWSIISGHTRIISRSGLVILCSKEAS